VVHDLADGVDTASVDARVSAALVEASLISRTVLVDDTFWILADSRAVDDTTLPVLSAW